MWFFPPGSRRRLCRLTCPPSAANSSPRAGARYGRGPSLRCVHLRRTCSLLLCFRKGVRSHPLRGAYRACCAGLKRRVRFTSMDIFPTAANMVGVLGFEPRTSSLSGTRSNQLSYTPIQDYQSLSGCGLVKWWSRRDSNPQHPACKAGALAIELRPLAPKSCLAFRPWTSGTYAQAHLDLIEFSNSPAETSAR